MLLFKYVFKNQKKHILKIKYRKYHKEQPLRELFVSGHDVLRGEIRGFFLLFIYL